ncbi:MAG: hypothetical protein FWG98_00890 [Candidatus Cloacimonetes bacterium]|nr:hypothetical protein [Candidatus Cloacimonadota bacterium]
MTNIKSQAIELLQDIPDDKVLPIIEILKGLRLLYISKENTTTKETTITNAMGILNKYANPDLIPLEKEAWGMAVKEKHGKH